MRTTRLATIFTAGATLSLLSCDIPFVDNIYDDQSLMLADEDEATDGTMSYLNCTSYTDWVYVNLADGTTETRAYDEDEPDEWTFAMHRYDCKTNGGRALETTWTSLDEVSGDYDLAAFVSDTDSQIIIDMSGMMSGVIGYTDSPLNEELGKWMYVDTSNMPPSYTTSGRVYLIEQGGVVSAVCFTGYSNPYYYDTKGYISFDYMYAVGTGNGQ